MADTLQFDLVAPERKLASVAATEVQIPGMSGDFTAKPNHAPFLTTLRPGIVRVAAGAESMEYVVTGGFAEVSPEAATILAEQAVPRAEADAAMLDRPRHRRRARPRRGPRGPRAWPPASACATPACSSRSSATSLGRGPRLRSKTALGQADPS